MTLAEYVQNLQELLPTWGDLEVVYASDDGERYHPVFYKPSLGYYVDGEFQTDHVMPASAIKAVCVN